MPAPTAEIELWVIIDDSGDYAVGKDAEAATEAYANDIGELSAVNGFRTVSVKLTVPLPALVELAGVVPEIAGPGLLTVN